MLDIESYKETINLELRSYESKSPLCLEWNYTMIETH